LIPLALFFVLFLYRFLPLDLRFNVSGLQSRVISGTSGIMHWLKNFNKPGAEVDGKQNKFYRCMENPPAFITHHSITIRICVKNRSLSICMENHTQKDLVWYDSQNRLSQAKFSEYVVKSLHIRNKH